jgi:hypothetical protein
LKSSQGTRGSRGRFGLLAVLAAIATHHLGHLAQPFFADDFLFLESLESTLLARAILGHNLLGHYYRPLSRDGYFALLHTLGGDSAALFHCANLVVLLAACALLYVLVSRWLGVRAAVLAALYLGLHSASNVL